MQAFFIANSLLEDPQAFKQSFRANGYVYLKQLIDKNILNELKAKMMQICVQHSWLKPGADPVEAIPWTVPKVEGDDEFLLVYQEIQKLEAFHSLAHHPKIMQVMRNLLDQSAFPHPLSIARLMFPQNTDWTTPPHQDYANNQGTPELYACWIPLSDCPVELGSLSILQGSHKYGLLPRTYALGPGHRQAVLDKKMQALPWVGGDFELGDAIIFHSHTVHQSLPNETDRMRVSVDYRYQSEHQPLTENCLLPHFQTVTWEEVYASWESDELKYYWKDKTYEVVPWNDNIDPSAKDEIDTAVRMKMAYDRKRAALKDQYEPKA